MAFMDVGADSLVMKYFGKQKSLLTDIGLI